MALEPSLHLTHPHSLRQIYLKPVRYSLPYTKKLWLLVLFCASLAHIFPPLPLPHSRHFYLSSPLTSFDKPTCALTTH
ncbi:uncharacterized protein BO97DRAFT_83809 [Aspergillus homomorphus CBS 101889]|uniref:Uncharacterized protein n=1 Tax=Aspergillus homomorphus (strain CBS 101889) TaxID=1450537 RepID=A0A395IA27_ASPHC|nr:hypothetical protein BO97DRAFT_83809 [Aspergillus homomorphus CBS 101889]RAL17110.1 hypothetical protein BO97DRAFT_83809 [Aspergillus homomorphus CBS 101889]